LAFVTQGIVMKASNLALRVEPSEDQPEPPVGTRQIQRPAPPGLAGVRLRVRRPFAFRTIVSREQGLRMFRCG
jgi:hypothetical protein